MSQTFVSFYFLFFDPCAYLIVLRGRNYDKYDGSINFIMCWGFEKRSYVWTYDYEVPHHVSTIHTDDEIKINPKQYICKISWNETLEIIWGAVLLYFDLYIQHSVDNVLIIINKLWSFVLCLLWLLQNFWIVHLLLVAS